LSEGFGTSPRLCRFERSGAVIVKDYSGIMLILGSLVIMVAVFSIFGRGVIRHELHRNLSINMETSTSPLNVN
jgi:hypothetical protein